mmetsp:Transcript_47510/g.83533  ORF Transcript_47510/g.83533 Transcript_47510/m.83533 type:complete len:214 (+) Transcript_47510:393-1034(+)
MCSTFALPLPTILAAVGKSGCMRSACTMTLQLQPAAGHPSDPLPFIGAPLPLPLPIIASIGMGALLGSEPEGEAGMPPIRGGPPAPGTGIPGMPICGICALPSMPMVMPGGAAAGPPGIGKVPPMVGICPGPAMPRVGAPRVPGAGNVPPGIGIPPGCLCSGGLSCSGLPSTAARAPWTPSKLHWCPLSCLWQSAASIGSAKVTTPTSRAPSR